jgi:hypothetical protein
VIRICESCWHEIEPDEEVAVLRSLVDRDTENRPVWRELYLHHWDAEHKRCKTP